jgi:hypothetical protein
VHLLAACLSRIAFGSISSGVESDPQVKLRMQIGANKLEVEGPTAVVAAMLMEWKQLAGLVPAAATPSAEENAAAAQKAEIDAKIASLFAVDPQRELLTLCRAPRGKRRNGEAALLLLYGYSLRSGNSTDGVPGRHLFAALRASGLRFQRLDRVVASYIADGLLRRHGIHLQERYALTDAGRQHAEKLALAFVADGSAA